MAYEEFLHSITLEADASLAVATGVDSVSSGTNPSGLQYRFVKVTGEHTAGLATAATDVCVGVSQSKPQATGHSLTVGVFGVSRVEAGGAVTAGSGVTADSTGRAISSGTNVKGVALRSATVAGQLIPVLLRLQ